MNDQILFHDIYDYYYEPFFQTILGKLVILLLVALITSLITYLIIHRKRKKIPAWLWALQQIDQLNKKKCSNKKEFKSFYFSLTSIIKQYLSKRYSWKTMDKTDEELTNYLKEQRFDPELLQVLGKMLQGASWVKFAGEDVIKTQAEKDLEQAKELIKKTIPEDEN